MVEVLCSIIAAVATILSASMAYRVSRENKRTEARAERRARESRLSMEMMSATCALSLVTAKKLSGQHTNGDVEEAMAKADKAQREYIDFIRDVASQQVSKT